MKPLKQSKQSSETGLMRVLFLRIIARNWIQHWLKTASLLAIVALGVGVFLAIGLTNRAAVASFRSFTDAVTGQSQLSLSSRSGSLTLGDAAKARQALMDSEASLFPSLERSVRPLLNLEDAERPHLTLIGIDLLAAASHLTRAAKNAPAAPSQLESINLFEMLEAGNYFFASQSLAARYGWENERPAPFLLGDKRLELVYGGAAPVRSNRASDEIKAIVMDLYQLQELGGLGQEIDSIELVFPQESPPSEYVDAAAKALDLANPGHWIVESRQERQQTGAVMTLALRSNLRALSALSLVVALLLVFQALDGAVSRRKPEIAALRSLGITPNAIQKLWLWEAGMIGALGGLGGIFLGRILAQFTTGLVDRTVSTLYYFTNGSKVSYHPGEMALAWGLAVAASLAAGWWPARQASRVPTAQLLKRGQEENRYRPRPYLIAAAAGLAGAAAFYPIEPIPAANGHGIPIGGYLMALSMTVGLVALACPMLQILPRLLQGIAERTAWARVGVSRFRQPNTRHRLALGSIVVAVGMTAAMIVLIESFERTVERWMNIVLQADAYVRSRAAASVAHQNDIPPEVWKTLLQRDDVAYGGTIVKSRARIHDLETDLVGYDVDYLIADPHIAWIGPVPDLRELSGGHSAIVNESFAARFKVDIGQGVSLETSRGPQNLKVIGIQSDFGNERGNIAVDRAALSAWLGHERAQGLALHFKANTDLPDAIADLRALHPELAIVSNRELREQALSVFKQTFSITYALKGIGLFIAASGLGAMLFSVLLERRAEIGALRRIGMSRRDLAAAAGLEGFSLAGLGALVGVALGLCQGAVLVFVVNKQSFGWTLDAHLPWMSLCGLVLLVLAVGAGVAWKVGHWNAGLKIENEE